MNHQTERPWTSEAAYREILDTLPVRRRAVFQALRSCLLTFKRYPTAKELTEFSSIDGAWKRLPELAACGAVERKGARRCKVTGRMAETWGFATPRPAEGQLF